MKRYLIIIIDESLAMTVAGTRTIPYQNYF
jgi:hypothetical protein